MCLWPPRPLVAVRDVIDWWCHWYLHWQCEQAENLRLVQAKVRHFTCKFTHTHRGPRAACQGARPANESWKKEVSYKGRLQSPRSWICNQGLRATRRGGGSWGRSGNQRHY